MNYMVFHSPLLAFSDSWYSWGRVIWKKVKNHLRWNDQHSSGKVLSRFGNTGSSCFAAYQNFTRMPKWTTKTTTSVSFRRPTAMSKTCTIAKKLRDDSFQMCVATENKIWSIQCFIVEQIFDDGQCFLQASPCCGHQR